MALEQDPDIPRSTADMRAGQPPDPPPFPVPAVTASLTPADPDQSFPGGTFGTTVASDDTSPFPPSPLGGGTPSVMQGLLEDDREALRNKIMVEGSALREQDRLDRQYSQRMEQMFSAQMATANELRPWDARREMASRKHDLWEQFGSPGFLIAMMASAFTAMPMVSALNGGAAVMNAINQGDMDAYDEAFKAWKDNTDLVLKRMDIQQRAFQNIQQLRKDNLEEFREKMAQNATMYNDTRTMNLLNYGFDKEAIEAQEGLATLQEKLASSRKALQESNAWTMMVQGDPEWPYGFDGKLKPEYASGKKRPDPQKMHAILTRANMAIDTSVPTTAEAAGLRGLYTTPGFLEMDPDPQRKMINDMLSGIAAARSTGKGTIGNEEVRRQMAVWDQNHQDASDDEKTAAHNKIYADWINNQQWGKLSTQERNMRMAENDWDNAHPEATPEEREAAHRKIFQDWADAKQHSKLSAERLKQMWNPQWLDSPQGKEWRSQQPPEVQEQYNTFVQQYSKGNIKIDPSMQGWAPEAIDAAAETFNETGMLPHYLGARTVGPQIMGAVQARALELLKERYPELKDDPQKLIAQRTKNWQLYHTQQVALNRYESGTQGQTITSMNVVVQHLQVLKDLSDAQDRSDWTRFNRIASWWGEEFGQEAPTDANVAAIIVGNEVIKAIQRGQLGTGEERDEAAKFFARFRSQEQIDGAIGIATKLLVGQLRAMKYGFMVATGQPESEFSRMLLPETRAYFSKAELDAMKPNSDVSGYTGIPSRRGNQKPLTPDDIEIIK